MDGFATTVALKALNPAVRVIASSGNATNDMQARAVAAGSVAFIVKPYTVDALLRAIHGVLTAPSA